MSSALWGGVVSNSCSSLGSGKSAGAAVIPAPVHVPPAGVFLNPPSNPRGALLRVVGSPMDKATATATSSFAPAGAPGPWASAPTAVGGPTPELARGHMGGDDDILVGLRLGDFGGRVGMLPGLRPKFMDKYAPPGEVTEKKRRAPREDLTGYTAEEKVARRNERARIYTNQARARQEELQRELESELQEFRLYAVLVEQAPQVGLLVLRADLHAVVLYANRPLEQLLGLHHEAMLGQPLWSYLHPADHARLAGPMGDLILTLTPPQQAIRCRLRRAAGAEAKAGGKRKKAAGAGGFAVAAAASTAAPGPVVVREEGGHEYLRVRFNMRNGMQGLVCSVWPEARW